MLVRCFVAKLHVCQYSIECECEPDMRLRLNLTAQHATVHEVQAASGL